VRVERIDSRAELLQLREVWNALLRRSDVQHPFLTWEFVTTWWDVYHEGQRLCVLVARDLDGTIVGVAPLKIRTRRLLGLRLRTLGCLGDGSDVIVDRLGFITAPHCVDDVVHAFVAWMLAADDVDGLDLTPLAEDVPSTATAARLLRAGGAEIRTRESICPAARLPPTWAGFLESRSRNYRKKFREFERRTAVEYGAVVRQSGSVGEAAADLEDLAVLHRRRWLDASRAFQSEAYLTFHRRLAVTFLEQGWLRMFVLDTPRGPIAALYCLAFGDGYYYYQSGRDPAYAKHRVGLVLMQHALRKAVEEGACLFDFLRGQEPYKYTWADIDRPNVRIRYWKRPSARALDTVLSTLDRVRHRARSARRAWVRERDVATQPPAPRGEADGGGP
jgi:CelD/BcsL family acetyltransferase involved in cellulose biosynthesis